MPLWLPFSGSSVNCLLCRDKDVCFQILPTSSEVRWVGRQGPGPYQQMSSAASPPCCEAVSPTPLWAFVLFAKRSKGKHVICVVRKAYASSTQWLLCRHWELICCRVFLCRADVKSEFIFHRLILIVLKKNKCCCVLPPQMRWKMRFAQFMLGGPFNTKSCFWRPEAEMGFCFPDCQSPGIHGTSRYPVRPEEAVGERCAGQPANTNVLSTTITFLAFGSSFFFNYIFFFTSSEIL